MVSKTIITAAGIAIGIAVGIGIGFGALSGSLASLDKQIKEQDSKISALESELETAKNAALGRQGSQSLQSMSSDAQIVVPPVKGFYEGQEILFIHTEASDQNVASMLTMMMDSPVILVPSLKEVPASSLGEVYVFTNGIEGEGPFGFQSDVFSSVPTDSDYTPLRAVKLVSWNDTTVAKELRSVKEIMDAEAKGELTISSPGVVVNMPIVRWPGGQR